MAFPFPESFPEFSNIQQIFITNGVGHIGMNVTLDDGTLPCKTPSDPSYPASQVPGGYEYYYEFGFERIYCAPVPRNPSDESRWQRFGLFIANSVEQSSCPVNGNPRIQHNWGKRVVRADVEIYPWVSLSDPTYRPGVNQLGGARFSVTNWSIFANGGRYSPEIGAFALPSIDRPHGLLNGFVWEDVSRRRTAAAGRLAIDMFQQGNEPRSSTGYSIEGFASTGNKADGYYTSGPLYPGTYLLYVTDTKTGRSMQPFQTGVFRPYEKISFEVSETGPPRIVNDFKPLLSALEIENSCATPADY